MCECLGVVYPTGEIGNVDTGKRVGFAGVAADAEDLRELGGVVENVGVEVRDGVLVADGALVPVVRDLFVAWVVSKASGFAGDGEKALEHFLVEDALGVFGGLVAHEAVDEGEGGLGDEDAGERAVEEVGVLRD